MPEVEIIDNPKLRSVFRDIGEWGFTTFMWALWVYLFLPVLNLILWLLGAHFFFVEIVKKGGFSEMVELVKRLGLAVVVVFVILRLWGYYNYVKFGKKDRRRSSQETHLEDLAQHFSLSAEEVQALQQKKEIFWPLHHESGAPSEY
ncbi:MAG: poly-beta-1,6-N-acetyl-D-glucosamine biosynthesis protein PgaD [Deltaproteobacteria bacterium]|nr:poly-beta-1,6-N-acetyl-D-glucosamine biosynthesis protein PgaD [Deltaproteobacteria bacterium]MBW1929372.1 poly-beta-1,6-N-acetyl-D-glucosamine biosynthesis protein PgaD [Deltaproteobacteria bacterium]MBW2026280.1 poly-beta-1,6-N-acetyl-D-glucosamine biosynthesis protein PgaD [Deltaproteobacteria bacterium]MBW2126549.1 poly-beta-1,6-N-acetyl-D-glucosamine biosynthesis protein PgaD [Deltaproteobacteria bacterium]RLB17250.1 MAG: poly-beta-1,6-N-acetyl-D-glucosamine biosynthesis protein PgaD [D